MDTSSTPVPATHELTPLDERELQINEDYDWALRDPDVQRQYAGLVVAVYKKKILGSGKWHTDATAEALKQPGCPPKGYFARVYIAGTPMPPK